MYIGSFKFKFQDVLEWGKEILYSIQDTNCLYHKDYKTCRSASKELTKTWYQQDVSDRTEKRLLSNKLGGKPLSLKKLD